MTSLTEQVESDPAPTTKAKPRPAPAKAASPTRRHILNTAREVIAERGFAAMQMAEVARRANLATGTLYRHFRSKDDLTAQVFREMATREIGLMRRIADEDASVEIRFTQCIRTFCERALKGRRVAKALLIDPLEDSLASERASLRTQQAEILAALLREAESDGSLAPSDPSTKAACITGALTAALVELDADAKALSARLDSVIEFCRLGAGFGAPGNESSTAAEDTAPSTKSLVAEEDEVRTTARREECSFSEIPDELI